MPHYVERLERMFNSVLDKWGQYVVYIRADRRIECSCWNPQSQEADPRCTLCLGLGYKITIEKALALLQLGMPMTQQEFAAAQTPIGILPVTGNSIFLKRHVWPRALDKIYDVEWDVSKDEVLGYGRVARLVDSYNIQIVDRFKDKNGEVVGHKCAVHSEETQYQWIEDQLKAIDFTWDPMLISGTRYKVGT